MIETQLLRQLVAFAECSTLSAAAERLHTSQPALTRAMKKLEAELGVSLFLRGKNKIELNETGSRATEYARHVLEACRDFETKVRSFDRSLRTLSIGYCAPVPQTVLLPVINSIFSGMTISADMKDDADFTERLLDGTYQLAVLHEAPDPAVFYSKKCGHEDLFISVKPGNPLAFYPELHLKDLDGMTILLLSRIGFWSRMHREKTPHARYLVQIDREALIELAENSDYPIFSSSYYISRGEVVAGRVHIPLASPECHSDFHLACLRAEAGKYKELFDRITESTIK